MAGAITSVQHNPLTVLLIDMRAPHDAQNKLNNNAAEAPSIDQLVTPLIGRLTTPGDTGAALEDTGQKPVVELLEMYSQGGKFMPYDVGFGGKIDIRV